MSQKQQPTTTPSAELARLEIDGVVYSTTVPTRQARFAFRPIDDGTKVRAIMPGAINEILVSEGDVVEVGTPLLVLEAMKMQNRILAQRSGIVTAIHVTAGVQVAKDHLLIEISAPDAQA